MQISRCITRDSITSRRKRKIYTRAKKIDIRNAIIFIYMYLYPISPRGSITICTLVWIRINLEQRHLKKKKRITNAFLFVFLCGYTVLACTLYHVLCSNTTFRFGQDITQSMTLFWHRSWTTKHMEIMSMLIVHPVWLFVIHLIYFVNAHNQFHGIYVHIFLLLYSHWVCVHVL